MLLNISLTISHDNDEAFTVLIQKSSVHFACGMLVATLSIEPTSKLMKQSIQKKKLMNP